MNLIAAATVHVDPDPSKLPGAGVLQQITDGIGGVALAVCVMALLVGAAMWAFGSHAQNPHQAMLGRRTVVTAVAAAMLVGATGAIVSWAFQLGTQV